MEAKVQRYVSRKETKKILESLKKIECAHKWKEAGYGYECKKCDYYTGQDEELNELIKKSLINKNG